MNNAMTVTETVESAQVGDTLPKAMSPSDMMRAFGISRTTFYRREVLGEFAPFLLARAIGRKRYAGEKVQRFLNGRCGTQ